jgi:hypothetical protein
LSNDLLPGDTDKWLARPCSHRVCSCGEQKRYRHRIENGDKRQRKQPDWSLKVRGRRSN